MTSPLLRKGEQPGDPGAALSLIGVRTARRLEVALGQLAGAAVEVAAESSELIRYADWLGSGRRAGKGWTIDGAARLIVAVDDAAAGWVLSRRYGGRDEGPARLGTLGARLVAPMADALVSALTDAAPALSPVGELVASDDLRGEDLARGSDQVAPVVFTLRADDRVVGTLALALTAAALARLVREPAPVPEGWPDELAQRVCRAPLDVRAVLAQPGITAAALARLAVGDVLPIPAPSRVQLVTGRTTLASAAVECIDGMAALRIQIIEGDAQ